MDGTHFGGRAVMRPGFSSRPSLGFLPFSEKLKASALLSVTKLVSQCIRVPTRVEFGVRRAEAGLAAAGHSGLMDG